MNSELEQRLDEDSLEELEELIQDDVMAGFLTNEEIQEDCMIYLENSYPELLEGISQDLFAQWVEQKRAEFGNTGTQEYYKKLDAAFDYLEERGMVAYHFAGFTIDDGFDTVNEIAAERYQNGEKVIGCCFYTHQDLLHVIHEDTTKLHISYGNCFDNPTAKEIGALIVEGLKHAGLEVEWDGNPDKKVAVLNMVWDKICDEQEKKDN